MATAQCQQELQNNFPHACPLRTRTHARTQFGRWGSGDNNASVAFPDSRSKYINFPLGFSQGVGFPN